MYCHNNNYTRALTILISKVDSTFSIGSVMVLFAAVNVYP